MRIKEIPVVTGDEFAVLAEHNPNLLQDQPWIIDGYIREWQAFDQWRDLATLREKFGHLQAFAKAPNFITHRKSRLVSVQTSFEQYLDYIEHPERAEEIYEGCWMEGDFSEFTDLGLPLYCGTLRMIRTADDPLFKHVDPLLPKPLTSWNHALPYYYTLFNHFWLLVSLPGALTPLHTDNNGTIALIAQLRGKKRAVLFSPADLPHVRNANGDFLDPDAGYDSEFPTAASATKWVGDIEEGQVLFVGTNWAHHVKTLKTSISVSFDFVDASNLAAYATASAWASALGNRAKRSPEFFANKLGNRLRSETIASSSPEDVGRLIMAEVLQSLSHGTQDTTVSMVQSRYAAHLNQYLNKTRYPA